jgi:hypothetical protein
MQIKASLRLEFEKPKAEKLFQKILTRSAAGFGTV